MQYIAAIKECVICDEKVSKPSYKKHKVMCEPKFIDKLDQKLYTGKENSLLCKRCDYKAIQKRYMIDHIRSEHFNIKIKCDECNIVCKNKTTLWKHDKMFHDKLWNGWLRCDKCKYVAQTEKLLTNHKEKIHNGLHFKCKSCMIRFKTKYARTRHWKSVHRREIGEIGEILETEEGEIKEEHKEGLKSIIHDMQLLSNKHIQLQI